MPQKIVILLIGAGLYASYRWWKAHAEKVEASKVKVKAKPAGERATSRARDLGPLVLDPVTGHYRPVDRAPRG